MKPATGLCRLCMQQPGIYNIYQADPVHPAITTAARITWVTQLEMAANDGLPAGICAKCSIQLDATYSFIEQCLATDRSLRLTSNQTGEEADSTSLGAVDPEEEEEEEEEEHYQVKPIDIKSEILDMQEDVPLASPTIFICSICDGSFKEKQSYIAHIRLHTSEQNTVYTCEVCTRAFNCQSHLKRHLRSHSGVKPYACTTCDKSFYRADHLKKHNRSHTGERPFHCTICPRSFSRRDHLSSHIKLHERVKPYKCDLCDKSFFKQSGLLKHSKCHPPMSAASQLECFGATCQPIDGQSRI